MPGKTTYYSRIQTFLELSSSRNHSSADELIENISRKSPLSFVYHRWDPEKEKIEGFCSIPAIKKTFELASEFELIDPQTGFLTKNGKEAADPSRYKSVLRKQILSFIDRLGCPISRLEQESQSCLVDSKICLPTADELYTRVSRYLNNLQLIKFRTLLRLLADCEGIASSRKQIYLPIIK